MGGGGVGRRRGGGGGGGGERGVKGGVDAVMHLKWRFSAQANTALMMS